MDEMSERTENTVNDEQLTPETESETQTVTEETTEETTESASDTENTQKPENNIAPKKKKWSVKKKILVTLAIIFGLLLLLIGGAFLAVDIYLDNMLDYISYDNVSDYSWNGVDIDDPSYGVDGDMGISWDEFSDPDAGRDESFDVSDIPDISDIPDESLPDIPDESDDNDNGSGSSNTSRPSGGGSTRPPEQFKPDYEIIEGIFDDDFITDAEEKDVVNILLIGADTISGKSARSDTMILMSINNVKKRIVFTSLMRDTYVTIPGYKNNRLNAAFAAGGPRLLIKTIKQNFDITVDYYFTVSIASFESAVDVIGGIDITVNENNYDYFKNFPEIKWLNKNEAMNGTHTVHLNGSKALGYARSRAYSNGDFTRTLHQRDLLTQFVNSCKGASLEELHSLLKSVLPYVVTDMPKETLKSMIWDVLDYVSYTVTDGRVPCPGSFKYANINGREVLSIDFEKNRQYLKAKIYG